MRNLQADIIDFLASLGYNTRTTIESERSVKIHAGRSSGVIVRELDKEVARNYSPIFRHNVRISVNGVIRVTVD